MTIEADITNLIPIARMTRPVFPLSDAGQVKHLVHSESDPMEFLLLVLVVIVTIYHFILLFLVNNMLRPSQQTILAFLRTPALVARVASPNHGEAERLEAKAVFACSEGVLAGDVEEGSWVGMQAEGMVPGYSVAHCFFGLIGKN